MARVWLSGLVVITSVLNGMESGSSPDKKIKLEMQQVTPLRVFNKIKSFLPIKKQLIGRHDLWINSITLRSDGTEIISGSNDKTVRVWDIKRAKERVKFNHNSSINCVTCTPDNNQLAFCSVDGSICLVDLNTQKSRTMYDGGVKSVSFISNDQLALGLNSGSIKIWDVKKGEEVATLERHNKSVHNLAFAPNNNQLAFVCSEDGSYDEIQIWDLNTQKMIEKLEQKYRIHSITFSFDENKLLFLSGSKVKLWNVRNRDIVRYDNFFAYSAALDHDCNQLAVGEDSGDIYLYDLRAAKIKTKLKDEFIVDKLRFTSDDKQLVSVIGTKINLWDIEQTEILQKIEKMNMRGLNELEEYARIKETPWGELIDHAEKE